MGILYEDFFWCQGDFSPFPITVLQSQKVVKRDYISQNPSHYISCPTLCTPMDCSLPGSSVHGNCQARILEFPSLGDLPNPQIEPRSPTLQVDSLPSERPGKPMVSQSTTRATVLLLLKLKVRSIRVSQQNDPLNRWLRIILTYASPYWIQISLLCIVYWGQHSLRRSRG